MGNAVLNILLLMEVVTDVNLFLRMEKDQTGTSGLSSYLTPAVTDGLSL